MLARRHLAAAVVVSGVLSAAVPAAAEIRVDRADMVIGPLVVTGRAPPQATVTLDVGFETIVIEADRHGRFAWIGDEAPLGCLVIVGRGLERVQVPVGACSATPPITDYGAADEPVYGSRIRLRPPRR
ncbi:MAG: hypothetical protein JO021_03915 [Alphaproteobacteria bacterium]|nr:hypothetical protein [Alphaproteobacteria bacterium]